MKDKCVLDFGLMQLQSLDQELQQHVGHEVVGEHWMDCNHEEN